MLDSTRVIASRKNRWFFCARELPTPLAQLILGFSRNGMSGMAGPPALGPADRRDDGERVQSSTGMYEYKVLLARKPVIVTMDEDAVWTDKKWLEAN